MWNEIGFPSKKMKIHKLGDPGKSINRPTSNISVYLDSFMSPLAEQFPTYVKVQITPPYHDSFNSSSHGSHIFFDHGHQIALYRHTT